MPEFPITIKCPSCGNNVKRKDRQKRGFIILIVGISMSKFSWSSGTIGALIAWFSILFMGMCDIMTSDRFYYRCKECADVINPNPSDTDEIR